MFNDYSNEASKFAIKKWHVIDSQIANYKYNQNNSIKFETKSIKSSLCNYSDPFVLVTGDIIATANNDTDVAFKNCAPFTPCKTKINDVFIDEANHFYLAMPIHNLIEYSDNYSDTSGGLCSLKANNANSSVDDSLSFKYKAILAGKTVNAVKNSNSSVKTTKLVVTLKYLYNLSRSLEMTLINCKIHFELNRIEDCILSSAGDSAKSKITDAKLHIPIATLSTKDTANLTK